MSLEALKGVKSLFETAGSDALVTGDHAWGADPVVARSAGESARSQIKNAFPDINDATLDHTVSRGVMITRGQFMGNLGMTMEGLSGGDTSDDAIDYKKSDEILKVIFGDANQLDSFKEY